MKKIVIVCPKCKKKMKIGDNPAKYKCPHCQEIYKFTALKRVIHNFTSSIKGWKYKIAYKWQTAKNAAQYMKMMKAQQKKNK